MDDRNEENKSEETKRLYNKFLKLTNQIKAATQDDEIAPDPPQPLFPPTWEPPDEWSKDWLSLYNEAYADEVYWGAANPSVISNWNMSKADLQKFLDKAYEQSGVSAARHETGLTEIAIRQAKNLVARLKDETGKAERDLANATGRTGSQAGRKAAQAKLDALRERLRVANSQLRLALETPENRLEAVRMGEERPGLTLQRGIEGKPDRVRGHDIPPRAVVDPARRRLYASSLRSGGRIPGQGEAEFGQDFSRAAKENLPRLRPDPGTEVYVRNFPLHTTEEDLEELFEKTTWSEGIPFGSVKNVSIKKDPVTGRSRGFGFVTMDSEESANRAIEQLNKTLYPGPYTGVLGDTLPPRYLHVDKAYLPDNASREKNLSNQLRELNDIRADLRLHGPTEFGGTPAGENIFEDLDRQVENIEEELAAIRANRDWERPRSLELAIKLGDLPLSNIDPETETTAEPTVRPMFRPLTGTESGGRSWRLPDDANAPAFVPPTPEELRLRERVQENWIRQEPPSVERVPVGTEGVQRVYEDNWYDRLRKALLGPGALPPLGVDPNVVLPQGSDFDFDSILTLTPEERNALKRGVPPTPDQRRKISNYFRQFYPRQFYGVDPTDFFPPERRR